MDNRIVVSKIQDKVQTIRDYCKGVSDYKSFISNKMLVEACVFNLSQIGELTKLIDVEYKAQHNEIEWNEIYGLRNRIIHDYDGVNLELIWEIISEDLEELAYKLNSL